MSVPSITGEPTDRARVCWLLTDGAPGHESQSRGIADAIARFQPLHIEKISLQVRRRFLKSIGRVVLKTPFADPWLHWVYDITLPARQPDFIVSSGGNTMLANALLARRLRVPNFYSGTCKGYPPEFYSRIFTVTDQGAPNNVVLPLPPVPGDMCIALPPVQDDAPMAVLVGGDGGGLEYSADDWRALAEQISVLAAVRRQRILLTTSRRTGVEAEEILAQTLVKEVIEETVFWSREPRRVVKDFLARAASVYVTGDSMTMIAEAIYTGRPVTVLEPASSQREAQDAQALAGYVRAGFVRVTPITELAMHSAVENAVPVPDVQALVWQSVREFF